jgi:hypothetical protein
VEKGYDDSTDIILKLEIHRRFIGPAYSQPMTVVDLYVYLYGLIKDQRSFALVGIVHLDCHSGNQLISLHNEEISFSWSDFGYSILFVGSSDALTSTELYAQASSSMFSHLLSKAERTGDKTLISDIKSIYSFHEELKSLGKSSDAQFFTSVADKVQEIVDNLDYSLMLKVAHRTGSAVTGTISNMNTRMTAVETQLKVQDDELKDQARQIADLQAHLPNRVNETYPKNDAVSYIF